MNGQDPRQYNNSGEYNQNTYQQNPNQEQQYQQNQQNQQNQQYQNPPYQNPQYQEYYNQIRQAKGFSIAALSFGIACISCGWIPILGRGVVLYAALAIVFGVLGKQKSKLFGLSTKMATAGFVLGIVGLALKLISLAFIIIFSLYGGYSLIYQIFSQLL